MERINFVVLFSLFLSCVSWKDGYSVPLSSSQEESILENWKNEDFFDKNALYIFSETFSKKHLGKEILDFLTEKGFSYQIYSYKPLSQDFNSYDSSGLVTGYFINKINIEPIMYSQLIIGNEKIIHSYYIDKDGALSLQFKGKMNS